MEKSGAEKRGPYKTYVETQRLRLAPKNQRRLQLLHKPCSGGRHCDIVIRVVIPNGLWPRLDARIRFVSRRSLLDSLSDMRISRAERGPDWPVRGSGVARKDTRASPSVTSGACCFFIRVKRKQSALTQLQTMIVIMMSKKIHDQPKLTNKTIVVSCGISFVYKEYYLRTLVELNLRV